GAHAAGGGPHLCAVLLQDQCVPAAYRQAARRHVDSGVESAAARGLPALRVLQRLLSARRPVPPDRGRGRQRGGRARRVHLRTRQGGRRVRARASRPAAPHRAAPGPCSERAAAAVALRDRQECQRRGARPDGPGRADRGGGRRDPGRQPGGRFAARRGRRDPDREIGAARKYAGRYRAISPVDHGGRGTIGRRRRHDGACAAAAAPAAQRAGGPLMIESTWFVTARPAAIVFVADPDSAPRTAQDQLRNLYRLTPAEAAVAMAIARGEGLQAVADELEISLTTARTHLQHVFEKTETRRQAELVRLIVASGLYRVGGVTARPLRGE